ncbi:hypothetical protein BN1221_00565 [Brenneria goodwinii]|uniref:Uncharacterized protein n=1 Tax=Brenneria goodwinii TaxID=1109412 RepID=A0A0G4JQK6_9GAMM|nr:hypothetical protein BN1221_00565 [Brenneria goodwinii]
MAAAPAQEGWGGVRIKKLVDCSRRDIFICIDVGIKDFLQ